MSNPRKLPNRTADIPLLTLETARDSLAHTISMLRQLMLPVSESQAALAEAETAFATLANGINYVRSGGTLRVSK